MNVPVYNMQGKEVAQFTIDEKSLGGEINAALIKQAYVRYHANMRQGSARTKNRTQVEGSTRKIYKQKGTGNARHGDRKANLFKGGGHGQPKTKAFQAFLEGLKVDRSALVALPFEGEASENARRSGRNVEDVTLVRADQLNCFNMLNHRYLVIGKADLEAWLKGPSSQTGKEAKINPLGRQAKKVEVA